MRKAIKIVLAVFAVIVILLVAFAALIFLDLAAYTATGSTTLSNITPTGKALVVYDPGLTGAAKTVADKVASDLQAEHFTVTLAGIKSSAASKTSGYAIIIVGGPVYGDAPTASVKDFLSKLKPDAGTDVGVYGSGLGSTTPSDVATIRNAVPALQPNGALSNAIVVKIGQSENLAVRAQDFVNQVNM